MTILSKNYEIIKEIGRGGMGIVYLANDKRLDRKVAVKVLQLDPNLEPEDTQKIVQRFYKEGQSLARLAHPNIVSIYDIGEENNQYYMIMEFIEGRSLARLLQIKAPFAVDLVISIGIQITNALAYIHDKSILHRDIKPGNIMLSESGKAKLTDFGLAKLTDAKFSLTQTGSLFGSLMYIPPEQALGVKTLDHRADIYSLGITLYELVTGVSPFQDDTIAVVVRKVIDEDPQPPSSIVKGIPPELDEIILKSVRKSPNERYQTISEMEKELIKLKEMREEKASESSTNIISRDDLGEATTLTFSGKSEDNLLVSTIIQFLSLNNSSGVLTFRINNNLEGAIYVFEGNITHAELGKLTGIDAIGTAEGRVIVTTFPSNIHRVQQIINISAKFNRKVALIGRSMERVTKKAIALGYTQCPENVFIRQNDIDHYPPEQVTILTTGSQGEPMSILTRMAKGEHRVVVAPGDTIVISAIPIPGNEKMVFNTINKLFAKGAEVIYESNNQLHVSGHASKEELKLMINLTKPKYFVPIHGESRHLIHHAQLAESLHVPGDNIFVMNNGDVLEITSEKAEIVGQVPAEKILIDGSGLGHVKEDILKDRKLLSQEGIIFASVSLDGLKLSSGPKLISKGFILHEEDDVFYTKGTEYLTEKLNNVFASGSLADLVDMDQIIIDIVSEYAFKVTRRKPVVIPVVHLLNEM